MNSFRAITAGVLASFLTTVVFVGLLAVAIGGVVTNKDTVKGWLANQATYDKADGLVDQLVEGDNKQDANIGPLVNKVITFETYNSALAQGVDSLYAWLEGDVDKLRFKMALAPSAKSMQTKVATAIKQTLADLPRCKSVTADFNPIEAKCRPIGYNSAMVDQYLANTKELNGPLKELLKTGSISSDTIKIDTGTRDNIRLGYNILKSAPIYFGLALLLLGGVIVAISPSWIRGLRKVGIGLVIPTALLVITSFVINNIDWVSKITADMSGKEAKVATQLAEVIVPNITASLVKSIGIYAISLMLVGIALIVLSIILGRKGSNESSPATNPNSTTRLR